MIPNGEGWYYLAVKKLSVLIKGITSKHKGDFYCLNCLQKKNLNPMKEYVEIKLLLYKYAF